LKLPLYKIWRFLNLKLFILAEIFIVTIIKERTQQLEQATNVASQQDPNNPVNLAKRIPEDFVFSSEEAKSNQIETDLKFFKEEGYSDNDIDMYRSIMEEIGVDPTGAIQENIQVDTKKEKADITREAQAKLALNHQDLQFSEF